MFPLIPRPRPTACPNGSLTTPVREAVRRRNKWPIFVSEHTKKSATYFSYGEGGMGQNSHL
jgi:hypothetical protein